MKIPFEEMLQHEEEQAKQRYEQWKYERELEAVYMESVNGDDWGDRQ